TRQSTPVAFNKSSPSPPNDTIERWSAFSRDPKSRRCSPAQVLKHGTDDVTTPYCYWRFRLACVYLRLPACGGVTWNSRREHTFDALEKVARSAALHLLQRR